MMYRTKFPRLYELKDNLPQSNEPENLYFRDFENVLKTSEVARSSFSALEEELSLLDQKAWNFLKSEAIPLLSYRHPERNWQQLFNKLNEAKGYRLLKSLGCNQIRFIPRSTKNHIETPDLKGISHGIIILCEVKTINISDVEIKKRKNIIARSAEYELQKEFFNKFDSTLQKAKSQLLAYLPKDHCRRIAYFVIKFDEPLALEFEAYRTAYGKQLKQHINKKTEEIEIKIHRKNPNITIEATGYKIGRLCLSVLMSFFLLWPWLP